MAFEKGDPNINRNGRPVGSKNKINEEIKTQFANIIENRMPLFDEWLMQTAQTDPARAMDIMMKLSERFVPVLSRQELTGQDGGDINVSFKFGQQAKKEEE